MTEKLRRLRMPQRNTRRNLLLGSILVIASVTGVWFVVDANTRTEVFLVAAAPAASGSVIGSSSLRVARMNLGSSREVYLRPGDVGAGAYFLTTMATGQLVPRGSVATGIIDARQTVVISSVMPTPKSLKVGDLVDVWVSDLLDNNKFAPPITLVLDAEVTEVIEESGVLAEQSPKVQILVPIASVAPILDAIASKDALSMVLKRNLGND